MKRAQLKDILREIWQTKSRFIAIFAIIALGTGFFAGVKATCPDMKLTADKYFHDYNLMDIKAVSTYGLNNDDINALKAIDGVKDMQPAYSIDAIINTNSKERVAKIHSLPLGDQKGLINKLRVIEGRLPEKSGECVIEKSQYASIDLKLGDKITLSSGKEDKDISDYVKNDTYEIVGYVETPYYLTFEKGTSTLGNGSVAIYAMIPETDFKMDYFTEVFLTFKETRGLSAFTDQYKNVVSEKKNEVENVAKGREADRYDEIYNKAKSKLDEAKKELADGEKKQQDELGKAQRKLESAQKELNEGKKKLAAQKSKFSREVVSAESKIKQAQADLDKGEAQYSQQLAVFTQNKKFMPAEQAAATGAALKAAREKLDKGEEDLILQKNQLIKSKASVEAQFKSAQKKLDKAEVELDSGKKEYNKQKEQSEEKLQDARNKIIDGEKQISKIEKPKWYVFDRNNNPGYSSYGDDTGRVDAIAKIFPGFFFMVAAFVCLTTMTRMVEEHRTLIGTYKALGYGNFSIALKYLIYAAIASVTGSLFGLAVGMKLFPFVISNAYGMLYRLPPALTPFKIDYAFWITLGALACTSLTVYLACYKELWEQPAQLMRPKSPKMGKRVLLENIPFIWSKLNFFSKVTIRNLFRYKKRLIMTLLGVAGCTALMLAGFGLRDGISSIVPKQYGEVFKFDSMIIMDENSRSEDKQSVIKYFKSNENISDTLNIRLKNIEAGTDNEWQKVNLIIPEDAAKIDKFISIHDMDSKKGIDLTDNGVVIGVKLSKLLKVNVGDEITLKDGEFKKVNVKVAAVNENYALHYIYMTPAFYQKVFGQKLVLNSILADMDDTAQQAEDKLSNDLVNNKAVLQVTFTSSTKKSFQDMVRNLNSIVFVMLISAGALAFVVLYNLTNININERIREIASIKVLGFYDYEVSQYVFRENIILTFIDTCFGLLGGIVLNRFVMQTSETDVVMFGREIYWYSFLLAALLTLAFSVFVNIVMHFKLKKVNVIESLKSVE